MRNRTKADTSAVCAINRHLRGRGSCVHRHIAQLCQLRGPLQTNQFLHLGQQKSHHLSSLAALSEGTEGVTFHGICCWAGGRNHSETDAGCMVSWTTFVRCSLKVARSTSWRKVALKASNVRAASYLRR